MSRPMITALAIVLCAFGLCFAAGWGWQTQRRVTRLEIWLFENRVEGPTDDE